MNDIPFHLILLLVLILQETLPYLEDTTTSSSMRIQARAFSLFLFASQDFSLAAFGGVAASSSLSRSMMSSSSPSFGGLADRKGQPNVAVAAAMLTNHAMIQEQQRAAFLTTRGGSSSTTTTTTALNSAVVAEGTETAPVEIFRKDYKPLPQIITKVNMDFNIQEGKTTVTSELFLKPNPVVSNNDNGNNDNNFMVLDGDETCVKLLSLSLDGRDLEEGTDYTLAPGKLILKTLPMTQSVLKTVVEIVPEDNTQLSGLYKSGPMYCTQCEAMGFRRVTYFTDRPDNLAVFERVRLEANQEDYPILLANGNMIEQGDVVAADAAAGEKGRHYAVWTDPFPKPSYLFCCVAASLGSIKDTYTTTSGRKVQLEVFSEKKNVGKLDYAMESLKRSMKWDEDKYGLEYDLDLYNIVAVDSFNMGGKQKNESK
jgi:hypothetical protein